MVLLSVLISVFLMWVQAAAVPYLLAFFILACAFAAEGNSVYKTAAGMTVGAFAAAAVL